MMKIAFATNDMKNIDEHFGWARQFAVYEIDKNSFKALEPIRFQQDMEEGDDKLEAKIAALCGCAIVYSAQIGPVAAARLVKNRMHPMKTKGEETINDILQRLLATLQGTPVPWLRKILNGQSPELIIKKKGG